jgi:hypothetical protein
MDHMAPEPDFEVIQHTLETIALSAGELILKGSEAVWQKSSASGLAAIKEKVNCK